MAHVYDAVDERLARPVAVKVLEPSPATDGPDGTLGPDRMACDPGRSGRLPDLRTSASAALTVREIQAVVMG